MVCHAPSVSKHLITRTMLLWKVIVLTVGVAVLDLGPGPGLVSPLKLRHPAPDAFCSSGPSQ